MIPTNKTVEIYYLVDEFLKEYDAVIKSHSLEEGAAKKRRNRKFTMSGSEVMTILILFHFSTFPLLLFSRPEAFLSLRPITHEV